MVTGFLDTSIIVDFLRQYPPAMTWLNQQQSLGISIIVWLEVVEGAQNKAEQKRALTLLQDFELHFLNQIDYGWVRQQMLAYQLSHQIGMMDTLIAAIPYRLKLPLYTRNLKHFTPLLGAFATTPY